jgi:hypothetical protein
MNQHSPVFVIGMNGSGTTMLADSLGHHPELYMFPLESKVLPYYLMHQSRFGDLDTLDARRQLAATLGKTKSYIQVNEETMVVLPDQQLARPGFEGVVDALYKYFAAKQGKTRWGDKSPINTQHVGALAMAFPTAQFVHIIRDGRDAAQSFHRRWGYDPLHTITRWKMAVTAAQDQGRVLGGGRYLEVRYEALTTDPNSEMQRICAFLGLQFDESVLHSSMRYMDPANKQAETGRIVPNSEKWREYFSAEKIHAIEEIAGATLSALGYPASMQGNHNPSRSKLLYWRLKDGLSFSIYFFGNHGLRAAPVYLRYVVNAARQWSSSGHR